MLFVCTAEQRLIALDTSRADQLLVRLGAAPEALQCGRSTTQRDRHLVDFKRRKCRGLLPSEGLLNALGHRYVTVFVDAAGDRNHLLFYDTTELGAWRMLSELHANWEHVA